MEVSIRLTKAEKKQALEYASTHCISLEEAFKKALFEQIEEEYDTSLANDAFEDYVKNETKSSPISELWQEVDL